MPNIVSKIIEIVVFKIEQDKPKYLLLHRQENERLYPNIWQIISGSIEKNEKSVDAALRELHEETQLKPIAFWIVPDITMFYDATNDWVHLCPVFAAQVSEGSQPKLSDEHNEFRWLNYEEAVKLPVWHGQQQAVRIVHEYIVAGKEAMNLNRIQ
ncbi:MAG: NUDIX domain-containing protein [Ignavibacteriae bacterium]|nr:NUDIX domain-containing protein [Ignavibacteriota bacterium]